MPLTRLAAILIGLLVSIATGQNTTPQPQVNTSFEDGKVGQIPADWGVPTPGFAAMLTDQEPHDGALCLRIGPAGTPAGAGRAPLGNVMRTIDARPFRGKRIALEAWVRAQAPEGGGAQMWLRVDRPGTKMGFFDNMGDRPVRTPEWTRCVIAGDVAPDAEWLNFGLMATGNATAWLDSLSLTITGEAGEGNQVPRTATDRGLANLVALARLSGDIRFFHPTTKNTGINWDSLMITAIEEAEPAPGPAELAAALERVFRPIAPTVRVWAGTPADAPPPDAAPTEATGAVAWRHIGVSISDQPNPIYSSTRTESPLGGEAAAGIPPAGTSIVRDLGAGISCRVPISLYTDAEGTLPRSAAQPPAPKRRAQWAPSGEDRSTRLAAVMLAWNVLQHFYPYFDVVDADWPAVLSESLRAAAVDADAGAFARTLRRLIARARDGHGGISAPFDARPDPLDLDWTWIGDDLVVTRASALAATTGLAAGDVVLALDGVPIAECFARVAPETSSATPQWLRFRALYELKILPPGPTALVTAQRGSGDTARRLTPTVDRRPMGRAPHSDGISRPMSGAEIRPGIVYFDLVAAEIADLERAMPRLARARGLVFDLRGYPGPAGAALFPHLIDEPVRSARWMLPVVTRPDREQMVFEAAERWLIQPMQPRLTTNVAFLTDGEAISYAESCMGIVEAYRLGEIVGSATAGTNGNVNPIPLPGGYTMMYTGMQVLKHDGSRHHGVGIAPTVPCERTVAGIIAGRDEVLDKALEVVGARIPQDATAPR